MGVRVTTIVACDVCKMDITPDDQFLNAQVYGVTVHGICFSKLNAYQVLRLLGLDEITYGYLRDYDALNSRWLNDKYKRALNLPGAKFPAVEERDG